jgi:hypothetical protein
MLRKTVTRVMTVPVGRGALRNLQMQTQRAKS